MNDKQIREDAQFLIERPEFRRFLFSAIQISGFFSAANGSDPVTSFAEGRRSLVLDILAMVETGQPAEHPDRIPILTLMQVLREEAQTKTEKPNAKRFSRNDELDDDPDAD